MAQGSMPTILDTGYLADSPYLTGEVNKGHNNPKGGR